MALSPSRYNVRRGRAIHSSSKGLGTQIYLPKEPLRPCPRASPPSVFVFHFEMVVAQISFNSNRAAMLLMALLLCQHSVGSFIKLRANTLREFQYLQCRGEYDKEQYAALTRLCDDCHNLYRQPQVITECKSDCFRNPFFIACVSLLKLEHLEDDFRNKVEVVSGNEL